MRNGPSSNRLRQERLDVVRGALEIPLLADGAFHLPPSTSLAAKQVIADAQHAAKGQRRPGHNALPVDKAAVGRAEIFDHDSAIRHRDEQVAARDIFSGKCDVELRIAADGDGRLAELDPASHPRAVDNDEIEFSVVSGCQRSSEVVDSCANRGRGIASRRFPARRVRRGHVGRAYGKPSGPRKEIPASRGSVRWLFRARAT